MKEISQKREVFFSFFFSFYSSQRDMPRSSKRQRKTLDTMASDELVHRLGMLFAYTTQEALKESERNVVVCTPSLYCNLASMLALLDKEHRIAIELQGVLGVTKTSDKEFFSNVKTLTREYPDTLSRASAIWMRPLLKPPVAELLIDMFPAMNVGRLTDQANMVQVINDWCSSATGGKITEVVQEVTPDTSMLIMDAMHFKATWEHEFDGVTSPGTFHPTDQESIRVGMMSFDRAPNLVYWKDGVTEDEFVELPYRNGFRAVVSMPKKGEPIAQYAHTFPLVYHEFLKAKKEGIKKQTVALRMPKFEISAQENLIPMLKSHGVQGIFQSSTEFSHGIETEQPQHVSELFQKVFLRVDEQGTEAAAVTVSRIILECAQVCDVRMTVDRPFIFMVVSPTGVPVIHAVVTRPDTM